MSIAATDGVGCILSQVDPVAEEASIREARVQTISMSKYLLSGLCPCPVKEQLFVGATTFGREATLLVWSPMGWSPLGFPRLTNPRSLQTILVRVNHTFGFPTIFFPIITMISIYFCTTPVG